MRKRATPRYLCTHFSFFLSFWFFSYFISAGNYGSFSDAVQTLFEDVSLSVETVIETIRLASGKRFVVILVDKLRHCSGRLPESEEKIQEGMTIILEKLSEILLKGKAEYDFLAVTSTNMLMVQKAMSKTGIEIEWLKLPLWTIEESLQVLGSPTNEEVKRIVASCNGHPGSVEHVQAFLERERKDGTINKTTKQQFCPERTFYKRGCDFVTSEQRLHIPSGLIIDTLLCKPLSLTAKVVGGAGLTPPVADVNEAIQNTALLNAPAEPTDTFVPICSLAAIVSVAECGRKYLEYSLRDLCRRLRTLTVGGATFPEFHLAFEEVKRDCHKEDGTDMLTLREFYSLPADHISGAVASKIRIKAICRSLHYVDRKYPLMFAVSEEKGEKKKKGVTGECNLWWYVPFLSKEKEAGKMKSSQNQEKNNKKMQEATKEKSERKESKEEKEEEVEPEDENAGNGRKRKAESTEDEEQYTKSKKVKQVSSAKEEKNSGNRSGKPRKEQKEDAMKNLNCFVEECAKHTQTWNGKPFRCFLLGLSLSLCYCLFCSH